MRLFIDTADFDDIKRYDKDDAISGFTTNATLVKRAGADVSELVFATHKDISVEYKSCPWEPNVRWKVTDHKTRQEATEASHWNLTAICSPQQVPRKMAQADIISVFAGRIMDTGRSPSDIITLAKRTGAQVLWASSRCVYDITLAEIHGCDIITVTPAIYEKYREWHGKPLELVAQETIEQFARDRGNDGLVREPPMVAPDRGVPVLRSTAHDLGVGLGQEHDVTR